MVKVGVVEIEFKPLNGERFDEIDREWAKFVEEVLKPVSVPGWLIYPEFKGVKEISDGQSGSR